MLRVQICQSLAYPLEIETEIERERVERERESFHILGTLKGTKLPSSPRVFDDSEVAAIFVNCDNTESEKPSRILEIRLSGCRVNNGFSIFGFGLQGLKTGP